jgi:ankyrin repeat protein
MIQIAITLILFFAGSTSAFAGPLHDAARQGDLEQARALIGEGAAIDARSDRGETPLILAILAGNDAIAELLIEKGAALDGRNAGGFTPLHAAAYAGDPAMAELLIERGADVNDARNNAGVTPLFPAIEEDHAAVAELLIAKGADLRMRERHGYTALARALLKGHKDMVVFLKTHGAKCPGPDVLEDSLYQECLDAAQ